VINSVLFDLVRGFERKLMVLYETPKVGPNVKILLANHYVKIQSVFHEKASILKHFTNYQRRFW
jgi:hypothetical protein